MLFITHDMRVAAQVCHRVMVMRHGKVVADGTSAEVKAMAAGRTVRATLPGADEASLLRIPGADHVEIRGNSVLVHASDSDAVPASHSGL